MLIRLKDESSLPVVTTPLPVVHAGDVVRITQQDTAMRMELTGVAEESGTVGGRVRVHMLHAMKTVPEYQGTWKGGPMKMLAIVCGPHEVEIVR
jgi:hypothetical protein